MCLDQELSLADSETHIAGYLCCSPSPKPRRGWIGQSVFKDSFPEVAENVSRDPVPEKEHFVLVEELSESDLLARHPGAVARFVFYILRNRVAPPLYYFELILKTVDSLRPFPKARNDLSQICERFAELDCPEAGTLRSLILGGTQEGSPPLASGFDPLRSSP